MFDTKEIRKQQLIKTKSGRTVIISSDYNSSLPNRREVVWLDNHSVNEATNVDVTFEDDGTFELPPSPTGGYARNHSTEIWTLKNYYGNKPYDFELTIKTKKD